MFNGWVSFEFEVSGSVRRVSCGRVNKGLYSACFLGKTRSNRKNGGERGDGMELHVLMCEGQIPPALVNCSILWTFCSID